MDILQQEAKVLFDVRTDLQKAEDARNAIDTQIEELITKHAPGLLVNKTAADEKVKSLKAAEKVAYTTFTDKLLGIVRGMSQPFGKGKVVPMVTIEEATQVEIEDPRNIGIVAAWLVARGMAQCIKFDFKPVAFFWEAKMGNTLPRTLDGLNEALLVQKGPNLKVASLENWPELDSWYDPALAAEEDPS